MKNFERYAAYYDLLYAEKDYKGEADYIQALIRKYHEGNPTTLLDLGCGTGNHAYHLAALGYEVDGVDLSEFMINRALQKKAGEYGKKLHFEVGNIQTVRTGKQYDVVISLFHVMSYQTTNEALQAAFETAKAHLKKGGLFIFDFWYGPGVLTDPPVVRVKRLENENIHVTRIAEPVMHPNENCVDVNYTIFVKDKLNGNVGEVNETHKMRYLFLPEIDNYASPVSAFDWMTTSQLALNSWNGVVVVKYNA